MPLFSLPVNTASQPQVIILNNTAITLTFPPEYKYFSDPLEVRTNSFFVSLVDLSVRPKLFALNCSPSTVGAELLN